MPVHCGTAPPLQPPPPPPYAKQDVSVEAGGGPAPVKGGAKSDEFDGFTFVEKPSALSEQQQDLLPQVDEGQNVMSSSRKDCIDHKLRRPPVVTFVEAICSE